MDLPLQFTKEEWNQCSNGAWDAGERYGNFRAASLVLGMANTYRGWGDNAEADVLELASKAIFALTAAKGEGE